MKLILIIVTVVGGVAAMEVDQQIKDDLQAVVGVVMKAQKEKDADLARSLHTEYTEIYMYVKGELVYEFQGKRADIPEAAFGFEQIASVDFPKKDKYEPCCQMRRSQGERARCVIASGRVTVHYENGNTLRGRVVVEVQYEGNKLRGRKLTNYL